MRPSERTHLGTAARWHFRLALGALAATAGLELAGQVLHGRAGAGPLAWLALLGCGGWVVGLVWRERVGVPRAWSCALWVLLGSLVAMILGIRSGFAFHQLTFPGIERAALAGVPVSIPLLWWCVVGGSYLVVEGLWGEWRAGVSVFTSLITLQLALMVIPLLGPLRGYWQWPGGAGGAIGLPGPALASWFLVALALAFGLVILGDNWSSAESRRRRQAWAPSAVLLTLTLVCVGPNLRGGQWVAVAFTVANGVLFGAVLVWYLRERSGAA